MNKEQFLAYIIRLKEEWGLTGFNIGFTIEEMERQLSNKMDVLKQEQKDLEEELKKLQELKEWFKEEIIE